MKEIHAKAEAIYRDQVVNNPNPIDKMAIIKKEIL